jgi:predicted nucleic acid-binding protein
LGTDAEMALYSTIADGLLEIEQLTEQDWRRIHQLVDRYRDLPLGGTDASLVTIAERLKVTRVATLDRRHFGTVRPEHAVAFEIYP